MMHQDYWVAVHQNNYPVMMITFGFTSEVPETGD